MALAKLPLFSRAIAGILTVIALASCSQSDDGAIDIGWIGTEEGLFSEGIRLSSEGQHLRAAIDSGLVKLDARGEVEPAIAETWIINEGGLSFIFRLREDHWPDQSEMTSDSVARKLQQIRMDLEGTSLGLDLVPIEEIRARTGRVIEIRLSSPIPNLLELLAQPELALQSQGGGTGVMTFERDGDAALLQFKPPAERGLPEEERWQEFVREMRLSAIPAEEALAQFENGELEAVLGGRLKDFPLVDTGPLSRGTVRVDPVRGLFGLQVQDNNGPLASVEMREALAMAINRQDLIAPYNLGGWATTTRIVAPGLIGDIGAIGERWQDISIEARRAIAASRVRGWIAANPSSGDGAVPITIALEPSAGYDIVYRDLASQLAQIGVRLERVEDGSNADLELVDSIARYGQARWYLNQFHCSLKRGVCDENADRLVKEARAVIDPVEQASLFAQAEASLTAKNAYIPLGAPLRWSLLRGSVDGFEPNVFGFHPLPSLAQIPR